MNDDDDDDDQGFFGIRVSRIFTQFQGWQISSVTMLILIIMSFCIIFIVVSE